MTNPEIPFKQPDLSYLIADCGHTNTTVILFDVVAGMYRLVAQASAPTTAGKPWLDIAQGVRQAIARLADITGRQLLNDKGELLRPSDATGRGVDHFAFSMSAAEPLKTVIVGLLDDVSVASARRALNSVYSQEVDCFNLADGRDEQAQVKAIRELEPDLIFIVGGTDGGADQRLMKLVDAVGLGLSILDPFNRPVVIYAGNKNLRQQITGRIGHLTSLHMADNVRPKLEIEQTQEASSLISGLYEDRKIDVVTGMNHLSAWTEIDAIPTSQAFARVMTYLANLYKGRILGVDLGSDTTTLILAENEGVRLAVEANLGMGRSILRLHSQGDLARVQHWLPIEVSAAYIHNFVYNKSVFPQTVPFTEEELYLEQGLAREILHCVGRKAAASWGDGRTEQMPQFQLLLIRGSTLANVPRPGQALLTVLDALQPSGIFAVAVDRYNVLPALGVLSGLAPLAVVQALEGGALVDLGWVIAPLGKAQPGQKIITVQMESETVGSLEIAV